MSVAAIRDLAEGIFYSFLSIITLLFQTIVATIVPLHAAAICRTHRQRHSAGGERDCRVIVRAILS
jgi:hypothetical protein